MPKTVYLSFDDGPNSPYTEQILKILKQAAIPASFFVCGQAVERSPQTLKKIAAAGHQIGSHSYWHSLLKTSLGLLVNETEQTHQLIDRQAKQPTRLFRAPWGIVTPWLGHQLRQRHYQIVAPEVFGDDWLAITPEQITERVLSRVRAGGQMVVLHDGHNGQPDADQSRTVAALPDIIELLLNDGYQFKALDLD